MRQSQERPWITKNSLNSRKGPRKRSLLSSARIKVEKAIAAFVACAKGGLGQAGGILDFIINSLGHDKMSLKSEGAIEALRDEITDRRKKSTIPVG